MNLISKGRADNFNRYEWLCDSNFGEWIVKILSTYGKTIIDVGCGNGYMFDFYASAFDRVAAIDPSRTFEDQVCDRAKKNKVDFRVAYAEEIPFESKSFDIAISKSSFHHFNNVSLGIDEMARVASKAIAIIEVVAPTSNTIPFLEKLLTEKESGRKQESVYTTETIDKLLMKNNSVLKIYRHYYDQYIDLDTWIKYSDLSSEKKIAIKGYINQMDSTVKNDMQYHMRNGHFSMLRRMYMAVAFIK